MYAVAESASELLFDATTDELLKDTVSVELDMAN